MSQLFRKPIHWIIAWLFAFLLIGVPVIAYVDSIRIVYLTVMLLFLSGMGIGTVLVIMTLQPTLRPFLKQTILGEMEKRVHPYTRPAEWRLTCGVWLLILLVLSLTFVVLLGSQ